MQRTFAIWEHAVHHQRRCSAAGLDRHRSSAQLGAAARRRVHDRATDQWWRVPWLLLLLLLLWARPRAVVWEKIGCIQPARSPGCECNGLRFLRLAQGLQR